MSDERKPRGITRRDMLRSAGAAGAAAVVGVPSLPTAAETSPVAAVEQTTTSAAMARGAYEHLTVGEAGLLEAIADQLIPADEHGPGAVDAHAVRFIDRALGGALADSLDAYRSGLAAFDRYCRSSRGGSFTSLSHTDQVSALIDVETGAATGAGAGFVGSSAAFFGMVHDHVLQGTFGDPYYGGNANFVGWDLIGYPGVRTAVTENDQLRLEANELPPFRRSAYEWDNFEKASVNAGRKGRRHGD